MYPLVVADIGGTNARFALVNGLNDKGNFDLEQQVTYPTKDYPTMQSCLSTYIAQLKNADPKHVCLAIAGPVMGDNISMTNLSWSWSISEVKNELGLTRLAVINDFTAQACSLPLLLGEDLVEVKAGVEVATATKAVLGPGTGLGAAGLLPVADKWYPISGEGGHRNLAAENDEEYAIVKLLAAELGHVSLETLLCGSGLLRLHKTLAQVRGVTPSCDSPSDITHAAAQGDDQLALDSVNMFCGMLGSASADLALTMGARGGLYLGGGILPRFGQMLHDSPFVARFKAKGVMSHFVAEIPVNLIVHPHPALLGAVGWMLSNA
jgi:glucokinase